MSGQGFAYTAEGFRPLVDGGAGTVPSGELIPFSVLPPPAPQSAVAVPIAPHATERHAKAGSGKTLKPSDVLSAARARVRELKAELKTMAKLKRELAQLERLLNAAKAKPTNVTPMRRTG